MDPLKPEVRHVHIRSQRRLFGSLYSARMPRHAASKHGFCIVVDVGRYFIESVTATTHQGIKGGGGSHSILTRGPDASVDS